MPEVKNIRVVDETTGEAVSVPVVFQQRVKNGFGKGEWFAMASAALDVLADFKRVEDYRVLFALLKRLDYENYIHASHTEIAKELGMHRPNVSLAIRRLIASTALLEGPRAGKHNTYRLNPSLGWKGTGKSHVIALRDYTKPKAK